MNILEDMKKELQQAEASVEDSRARAYRFMGIVDYLKAKIAEIEKAEAAEKAKPEAVPDA